MFVPLAREGWLQKLVATKLHPFGQWKVFWVELLEDGKLSWFDGAAKRKADFRRGADAQMTDRDARSYPLTLYVERCHETRRKAAKVQ